METAAIPSENSQKMPEKKGQRGTAVGQETHQSPTRTNWAAPPVIDDPKTHYELTRCSSNKAPSQDEVGPPHGDPQTEKPGGMTKPPGITSRPAEQIQKGQVPWKTAKKGKKEQETEKTIHHHIEKTGQKTTQGRSCRHPGPSRSLRSNFILTHFHSFPCLSPRRGVSGKMIMILGAIPLLLRGLKPEKNLSKYLQAPSSQSG